MSPKPSNRTYMISMMLFASDLQSWDVSMAHVFISALYVLIALTVPGCVRVCLRFAVGVGSPGVCMIHILIQTFILALNCEVL